MTAAIATASKKQYAAEWYQRNKARMRTVRNKRKRAYAQANRDAALAAKAAGCKFCGELHPAALDFHHRDPALKLSTVNRLLVSGSLQRVQQEIAKCDVVCANCHRKLHYQESHRG